MKDEDRCEKYISTGRPWYQNLRRCTRAGRRWVVARDRKAWLCNQHASIWDELGENSYGGQITGWLGRVR